MKLIKLQNKFILVNDEDAKNNELLYNLENNTICRAIGNAKVSHFKIIAGVEFLPLIDFSLLSKEDCKEIGWVDVEKLAIESVEYNTFPNIAERQKHINRFVEGFNTAQSLNDKMFSLEDIKKAYREGFKQREEPKPNNAKTFISSLQKTEWDVEVEMEVFTETIGTSEFDFMEQDNVRPKITNGKIKIIKIL